LIQAAGDDDRSDLLRLLTCGSVDDGKSTLIGRLLHDSKLVYDDHLASLEQDSKKIGSAGGDIDFSLLLDGLRAEREQGITIDVAYRYFSTPRRKFIIADCPGHIQYTRNMVTGASTANLAIVLIDASRGVLEQTRRHAFICSLLDIGHIVVAVNKMDIVDFEQSVFEDIRREFSDFASRLAARHLHFIPISALRGDNVVERSGATPWFRGRPMLEYLESVHIGSDRNLIDFRFPVQLVLRPDASFRGYAGTVASGVIRRDAEVIVLPSRQRSRIAEISTFDGPREEACPPQSVTLRLTDDIDVSRGDLIAHPHNLPRLSRQIEAAVVWLSEKPLRPERTYRLKQTTTEVNAEVRALRYRFDIATLHRCPAERLELNDIGRVHLVLDRPLAHDPYQTNHATGSFILIDPIDNGTVGAGMILDRTSADAADLVEGRSTNVKARKSQVDPTERAERLGHPPLVIWLTGLPRAGKSTIAHGLERRLFDIGHLATVIDGENLRLGLSENLGFAALDRSENLRRAAHSARLMAEAGLIAIVALVSPFSADRAAARALIGPDRFQLVWVKAPAERCAQRDPDQLYARARRGEIAQFTGVSAPYDEPDDADLVLDTESGSPTEAVDQLLAHLAHLRLLPL
jgi:bifunctional enzyme CysN/CysC